MKKINMRLFAAMLLLSVMPFSCITNEDESVKRTGLDDGTISMIELDSTITAV